MVLWVLIVHKQVRCRVGLFETLKCKVEGLKTKVQCIYFETRGGKVWLKKLQFICLYSDVLNLVVVRRL